MLLPPPLLQPPAVLLLLRRRVVQTRSASDSTWISSASMMLLVLTRPPNAMGVSRRFHRRPLHSGAAGQGAWQRGVGLRDRPAAQCHELAAAGAWMGQLCRWLLRNGSVWVTGQ